MRTFILVVLLAASSLCEGGEYIEGVKVIPSRTGKFFYPTNPNATCRTSPPGTSFCVESTACNQGNKIFTCTDEFSYTEPTPCADPTPYCTGQSGFAKCTAFPERYCDTSSNFKCPGVGYFPDLYDCYTYYECYLDPATRKLKSEQFRCSAGYPFSPDGKLNYKCLKSGSCVVPKCSSTIAAEWVPLNYTNYENIMTVYCMNGRPNYVYSCPPGLELNVNSLKNSESPYCEVKCTRDCTDTCQRAPYVNDNTRYFECRGGYPYESVCSRGRIFDPYTELCINPPF